MVCFLLCPATPPEKSTAKGSRGAAGNALLAMQSEPHQFALGLKDACCTEPAVCCASALGTFCCGLSACYFRQAVLDKYHKGIDDYVCCQGYMGKCCCVDTTTMCQGSAAGLYIEGCCCPVFSLSIARIHMMESKRIRPDPMDYQIIQCSNALQILSFILDIAAMFAEQLRELAIIIDLIADLFTLSVSGCMGAQIYHELKRDKDQIQFVVVQGVPVQQGQPMPAQYPVAVQGQPMRGAPPKGEEMDR